MAKLARRKLPDIVQNIADEAPQYQFFQALRLLDAVWHKKWVSLKPAPNISFPAADIRQAELDENDHLILQLTFMGLYGVDSPLPHYFLDACALDNEESENFRKFLDIFNHRLYRLLYLAWRKYQAHIQLENDHSDYYYYLRALSGMLLTEKDGREFAYAGLLGARVHNVIGLAELVSDYLDGTTVNIVSFVPRWLTLSEQTKLNGQHQLGNNTILGDEVLDLSGKITIEIGPLTEKKARQLLPGQQQANKLASIIMRYLGPTIIFDIALIIKFQNANILYLGCDNLQLGWVSWLGRLQTETVTLYFRNVHVPKEPFV